MPVQQRLKCFINARFLAGMIVFATVLVVGIVIVSTGSKNGELPRWGSLIVLITLAAGISGALAIFNWGRSKRANTDSISELREKGLLVSETFHATRAFAVTEFEDEGLHFFIELADGSVLFLSGQYLYDFKDARRKKAAGQVSFPCTEFTILRHKGFGYALEIQCAGRELSLECEAPPFSEEAFESDEVSEDSKVIRNQSYDDIKKERLEKGSSGR